MAWPQCSTPIADEQCALYKLEDEANSCIKQTLQEKSKTLTEFTQKESEIKLLNRHYENYKLSITDPRKFISKWLNSEMQSYANKKLIELENGSKDVNNDLKIAHEYIFSQTLGNENLYATNPIIKSIQGSVIRQIRGSTKDTLDQLSNLQISIEKINAESYRNHNNSSKKITGDCSILDRPERTELAIDSPEHYESLIIKCRK